jgi:hypothetical protein
MELFGPGFVKFDPTEHLIIVTGLAPILLTDLATATGHHNLWPCIFLALQPIPGIRRIPKDTHTMV